MTGGQGCIYSVYCVYLLSFLCSKNQIIFLKSQKKMNPSGTSLKLKILKSTSFLKISSDPRGGESSERTVIPQTDTSRATGAASNG